MCGFMLSFLHQVTRLDSNHKDYKLNAKLVHTWNRRDRNEFLGKGKEAHPIFVTTTTKIKNGECISASYGDEYWEMFVKQQNAFEDIIDVRDLDD